MFGVDEGRQPARLLRLRDDVQRQRRLARGLGTEDLDDAAARNAADAQRDVDADRSGGNRADGGEFLRSQAHDRAFTKLPLDLRQGSLRRFQFVSGNAGHVAPLNDFGEKKCADRQAFVW